MKYVLTSVDFGIEFLFSHSNFVTKPLAQCADEKSNESVEDMDGTFAGR